MSDNAVSEQSLPEPEPQSWFGVYSPIVLLVLSVLLIGVGLGLWVHVGAGLAAAGLVTLLIGILLGYS